MDKDSIKIIPRELLYGMAETQSKVSVPLWFLDAVSNAKSIKEAQKAINLMRHSDVEELIKLKSIHLGKVRLRVLDFEENKKRSKLEKKKSI